MPPFDVGDVVVCVDNRAGKHGVAPQRLARGNSYRITGLSPTGIGVCLAGVDPTPAVGFLASRFRKIDADVTEEFRETLRKLPVREPSNA